MKWSADRGFAPLYTGHEPIMFLLHQSAYILKYNNIYNIKLYSNVYILAPEGFEPSYVMMKTLCLKPLDYKALLNVYIIIYNNCIYIYITGKPSASIALASAGYKTATLLLC